MSLAKWSVTFLCLSASLIAAEPNIELLKAAKMGDASKVRALLEKGADANTTGEQGATPLMIASARGHLEAAKALIEKRVDLNIKDTSPLEMSALMVASLRGRLDIVALLLQNKASVDLTDKHGLNALGYAIKGEQEAVISTLEKHGATKTSVDRGSVFLWLSYLNATPCFQHLED